MEPVPQRAAWASINHHLGASVADIVVNVGGPCEEGCCPPMNFRPTHAGAVVNATRMTRPVVTLGGEGQSLLRMGRSRSTFAHDATFSPPP